jgi:hypothetical protein
MNPSAVAELRDLLAHYGTGLLNDARRCENLMRDRCPDCQTEIFLLTNALRERVPQALIQAPNRSPSGAMIAQLSAQLERTFALTPDAANWAVRSWAEALNLNVPATPSIQGAPASKALSPLPLVSGGKPLSWRPSKYVAVPVLTIALVIGVVARGSGAFLGASPVSTATVTPRPTARPPTPAPLPTATAAPTSTSAPKPTSTPTGPHVVYASYFDKGARGWAGGSEWKSVGGMLVNNGANCPNNGLDMAAPYDPGAHGLTDYKVVAQVQQISWQDAEFNHWGLVARFGTKGGYMAGFTQTWGYITNQMDAFALGTTDGNFDTPLQHKSFDPHHTWHTYELVVRGDDVQAYIDGGLWLDKIDNRFLSGGRVGFSDCSVQINVRAFKVLALQ